MFNNIGGKIKTLARIITYIGITASVIIGIATMFMPYKLAEIFDVTPASAAISFLTGFVIIIGGSLASWIGSFFIYGFGELIERVCLIEERLRK